MFKRLWKYAEHERWKVVVYLFFHLVAVIAQLGKPYAFAMAINALQKNGDNMINEIAQWLLIYAVCFFISEIFMRSARFIERYVAFRAQKRFILKMYNHLQSLSLKWHSDHHSGAVIDRINKAAKALFSFGQTQDTYVSVFVRFWGPMIILWQISPIISVVATIFGFLKILVTKKIYNKTVPEYRAQNEGEHNVASALHDYISNIITIIMLRVGKLVEKDIGNRIMKIFPHLVRENKFTHLKCFINGLLVLILEVGLIFYYIYSKNQAGEVIMIGSVTAIFQYLGLYMESFNFYAGNYESVIHWKTDFESIKPIVDEKTEVTPISDTQISSWENIAIRELCFSYGNSDHQLMDISMEFRKNCKIAIIGESGAGKSTLLKILRGLLPVINGFITIDGVENLPFHAISSTTTLIPQEAEIFENTIRYNITMGMPVDEKELADAIKTAGFNEVVNRLPKGLNSDVREKGVNFSGGEQRRLALARGIFAIKDSKIILLDEPTSGIDPANELNIIQGLLEMLTDKAVICVLHRLHLLRLFDYIYVLKNGKIVEEGTFNELNEFNGEFTRLWNKYLVEEIIENSD